MKRGIFVSDFQLGSVFGILPPSFECADGSIRLPNAGQEYLWRCWEDFCWRANKFDPHFVVVLGDVVDGPQPKQHATELSLVLMDDQERAAVEVLNLLKSRIRPECKWFFVQGTAYHVGDGAEHEEDVAKMLGGEKYWSLGTGNLVREVLWLDVEGVIIEASHHVGVTQGFYRLTALDREMQWSAMAAKDPSKGIPKADLLVRAHVHNYQAAEHASKQGLVLPCWQLQTRFMRRHSVYRMMPDIGGVFVEIDGDAKTQGEAPCRIRKELYSLSPVKVTKLE